MNDIRVLIIDDDDEGSASLRRTFTDAGITAESVSDTFAAMEKLRRRTYSAVILDPMIRHRLNGYAVLNFIELDQPETLEHVFLLTGMSEQTVRRTAPSVLQRLFRKPSGVANLASAVIESCGATTGKERKIKGSILLVEDDRVTANATACLLEELGYRVDWAQDGGDALEALATRDFDVIMLDLVMPHTDGFAVIDQLNAETPAVLRKVIITTAIPEKYARALDPGTFAGIIRKPVDVEMLEHLLVARLGSA